MTEYAGRARVWLTMSEETEPQLFEADAREARERAAEAQRQRQLADAKLREREADFTPRAVVREVLLWYFTNVLRISRHRPVDRSCKGCMVDGAEHWCPDPTNVLLVQRGGSVLSRPTPVLRIIDICAGAGVWASEVRRLLTLMGIAVHITAVELDPVEEPYLRRHADEVVIGDWRAFIERCRKEGRWFDLVIGNPAFSQARAPKVGKALDVEAAMPSVLMDVAGAIILYLSQQTWTKTKSGSEVRRRYPPSHAVDVPGSVNHRHGLNAKGKPYSADSIPYSASMWLGRIAGPHVGLTATGMLDPIDGSERRWVRENPNDRDTEPMRPGAEPVRWLEAQGIPYLGDDHG